MTEDDYGKPLLFKMPYDEDLPVNYFAGEISDGEVFAFAYVDNYGYEEHRYVMNVKQIPPETCYLRIDEIKD